MGSMLALASAIFYGISDVWGGLLSRRAHFAAVALASQLGGLLLALAAAPFLPASGLGAADLVWGGLSGIGTGLGMLFLNRGISRGTMSVVVPVSAVNGLALPVLAGVLLLGDRPSVAGWLGIVAAVPALWLVSRDGADGTGGLGLTDGLLAGGGIGIQYLALAQAGPEAGLWPIVIGRCTAALAILPLLKGPDPDRRPSLPGRVALWAGLNGGLAAVALTCYMVAVRLELVSVAVVLSSLYPVIPVLLGVTVLRERLRRTQIAGLAGAGAAIVLLTT
jgi:drug/metabolite transporter (DMT)-like permease